MIMTGVFKILVKREERKLRAAEARETGEEESRLGAGAVEDVDDKAASLRDTEQVLGYRSEKAV